MSCTPWAASKGILPKLPKRHTSQKFNPEEAMLCRNKVKRKSQYLNELIQNNPRAKQLEQIMNKESESINKIHHRKIKIYGKKPWDSPLKLRSRHSKSKLSADWIKLGISRNRKPIPMLSNVIDLLIPNRLGESYDNVKEKNFSSHESTPSHKRNTLNIPSTFKKPIISKFRRKRSNSRGCPTSISNFILFK